MRQRGFTLVELMVTLTILVLLLLAVAPGIGTWLDNTRIRNEGDSIMTGLQTARAEAVRRNKNVSFWLVHLTDPATLANDCTVSTTGTDGSWMVSINSPEGYCAIAPSPTNTPMIVSGRPMGGDSAKVSVKAIQSGGTAANTVTFNGFGRVSNSGAVTEFDLDGTGSGTYRKLHVMVTTMGSVRLCDPDTHLNANDPRKC